MRNLTRAAALLAALSFNPAHAADPANDPKGDVAWDIVSGLTTDVGQRLDGTEAEARARDWAKVRMTALGLKDVRIEPFTLTGYVRGHDAAELTAPVRQNLAVTALGYSGQTPDAGITAPVVYFHTLYALRAAPDGSLKGKIAFVDHAMVANQDGSGYGPFGNVRRQGPAIASKKGAIGIVIRSAGTDSHRIPHTGATDWGDATPIPAGAVSNPDADLVARTAAEGRAMTIHLTLTGHTQKDMASGNVIGDLPGSDPSLPPVLVACHLDSWDLGTGAIDNAAGCAIVTSAALKAHAAGTLRTIRVLWAGSEELGGWGGIAYAKAHGEEPHALAMESDFGADRVWRVDTRLADGDKALGDSIVEALNPMGVVPGRERANGGEDVAAIIEKQNLPVVDLGQDGTRYFDIHHTPDDTLDKIDPAKLDQNVEAWTRVLKIVANAKDIGKPAKAE
ncbi:MAG: M28 family peptidase [Sphingomonadales bacterium]|nr:M28 family peptidase [Sphingomonadales bacterium]MDE2570087.1 M28 family peptidase [Sphingomonadales bacterium]